MCAPAGRARREPEAAPGTAMAKEWGYADHNGECPAARRGAGVGALPRARPFPSDPARQAGSP